ncbi:MAG TPA: class I SAM-dependent methyltransferase [Gaiellaceae bacterium]|nr:class I SAM-dependent methyltransferase [Gaiellaceae bacterium]
MIDPRIERYAEEHSTPPSEIFERLAAATHAAHDVPQMMVGPLEGAFLAFVVHLKQPRRVLEIGTFTGWSSIAMAEALPPGGSIVSCDVNEETTAIARRFAEEAGVAARIDYRVGPALELLRELDGPFDLVFVDAWKHDYVAYYEAVLPLLADDGVILADNTLADGRVLEPADSPYTAAIVHFNDHVRADPRVECVLLTIRDGVTLIRKRHPA